MRAQPGATWWVQVARGNPAAAEAEFDRRSGSEGGRRSEPPPARRQHEVPGLEALVEHRRGEPRRSHRCADHQSARPQTKPPGPAGGRARAQRPQHREETALWRPEGHIPDRIGLPETLRDVRDSISAMRHLRRAYMRPVCQLRRLKRDGCLLRGGALSAEATANWPTPLRDQRQSQKAAARSEEGGDQRRRRQHCRMHSLRKAWRSAGPSPTFSGSDRRGGGVLGGSAQDCRTILNGSTGLKNDLRHTLASLPRRSAAARVTFSSPATGFTLAVT